MAIPAGTFATSRADRHFGENRIHLESPESIANRAVRKNYGRHEIKRFGHVFDRRCFEHQLHCHFGLGNLRHTTRDFHVCRAGRFFSFGGAK